MNLPRAVESHLAREVASARALAFFELGPGGELLGAGGPLEAYGLEGVQAGDCLTERLPFLVGLLPLQGPVEFPSVSWDEHVAHVHVFRGGDDSVWLLLLDAAGEVRRQRDRQQETNRLSLEKKSIEAGNLALGDYLASSGVVVFERLLRGFRLLSPPLPWVEQIWDEPVERGAVVSDLVQRLLMLESFLPDAESVWDGPEPEASCSSGPWLQPCASSTTGELPLEATATRAGSTHLLSVRLLGEDLSREQSLLQLARENRLLLDALRREGELKDVLAHCVVHDLMSPLTAMRCSLELLGEDGLSDPEQKELVDTGRTAATSQENLIRSILEVFRAEGVLEAPDPAQAPVLLDVALSVRDSLRPTSRMRRVGLEVLNELPHASVRVFAERSRLERVLLNLIENALRYSPAGSLVEIGLSEARGVLRVTVADRGPGVDASQAAGLFEKFQQAKGRKGGKVGLGLYFCRTVITQWGGEIGCEARPGGGSTFWFELPRVD